MLLGTRRDLLKIGGAVAITAAIGTPRIVRAANVLRIGQLGVMSGPAASWGLINRYSAMATAEMWNEKGGYEIGGQKYQIEIVRSNGLPPLLRLLRSSFLPLILSAAACVRNVSIHPLNESPIIDAGFLHPLIDLLSHEDNEE